MGFRDPVVAKRVRVLHVYPGFLNQVLDNERDQGYSRRPFRSRLTNLANQFMEQRIFVGNKKIRLTPKFRAAADVIEHMLDVFSGLPNVTDYRVMWCGLRAMPESPVSLLTALFRPNLRKLSLDISIENVVKLFANQCSTPSLANVEELNLVIRRDHCSDESVLHTIMKNHLAPVISRLRDTLRQLVIQTWEPLDLGPFFCALHFLPHLERLTLGIPIESPHLGDPNGVSTFLQCQSSTLRSLSLRATQNSGPGLSSIPFSFNTWISCALEDVRLPSLRDLSISSRLFPFPAALTCLERLSATITSLVLTGSYHTYADIVAVLDTFKDRPVIDRLETLRLGSIALTPQLLDLLADQLPRLYQLELLIREIAPKNDEALSIFPGDRTTRLVSAPIIFYQHVIRILICHSSLTGQFFFRNGKTQIFSLGSLSFQVYDDGLPLSYPFWTLAAAVPPLYTDYTWIFLTHPHTRL